MENVEQLGLKYTYIFQIDGFKLFNLNFEQKFMGNAHIITADVSINAEK